MRPLGEMVRELAPKGVKVPDGFAVTADAYRQYLRENQLDREVANILNGLDTATCRTWPGGGRLVRSAIVSATLPADRRGSASVGASATAATAARGARPSTPTWTSSRASTCDRGGAALHGRGRGGNAVYLFELRGAPPFVRSDNGPEFVADAEGVRREVASRAAGRDVPGPDEVTVRPRNYTSKLGHEWGLDRVRRASPAQPRGQASNPAAPRARRTQDSRGRRGSLTRSGLRSRHTGAGPGRGEGAGGIGRRWDGARAHRLPL